jgi:16S rRNA (guanine527-N7)-methyltransferase
MKNINWIDFSENYHRIINSEFSGLNLTALKTPEEIYLKQVIDSVSPLDQAPEFFNILEKSKYIIDLGTGGGFPLLPLAKIFSNTPCIGVDARNKKLVAVKKIAQNLNLPNVSILHTTFEDVIFDIPNASFVIKAVGKISEILNCLTLEYSSDFFFYKGTNFYQLEIEELNKLKNNYDLVKVHEISIEGLEKRYLVHIKYNGNVPRGTINNKKVKLFSKNI